MHPAQQRAFAHRAPRTRGRDARMRSHAHGAGPVGPHAASSRPPRPRRRPRCRPRQYGLWRTRTTNTPGRGDVERERLRLERRQARAPAAGVRHPACRRTSYTRQCASRAAQAQVGRPCADQAVLVRGRVVEARVRGRDPADPVVVEPAPVARRGSARGRRRRGGCARRRAGAAIRARARSRGDTYAVSQWLNVYGISMRSRSRAARREPAFERLVVGALGRRVAEALGRLADRRDHLPRQAQRRARRPRPARAGAAAPAQAATASSTGPAEQRAEPRHVAAERVRAASRRERREREVGERSRRARRARSRVPRVASSASAAEQRQRPAGREPERELAALREQQAEHRQRHERQRDRDARRRRRGAAREPPTDARPARGTAAATGLASAAPTAQRDGETGRGRAAARAAAPSAKAAPSANTSQPFASSASDAERREPQAGPARPLAPPRAHEAVEQMRARDRRQRADPDGRQQRGERREQHAVGGQVVAAVPGAVPDREAVLLEVLGAERVRGKVAQRRVPERERAASRRRRRARAPSGRRGSLHRCRNPRGYVCRHVRPVPRRGDHRPVLRASGGEPGRGRLVRPALRRRGRERGRDGGPLRGRGRPWQAASATTPGATGWSSACAPKASACAGWRACRAFPPRSRSCS